MLASHKHKIWLIADNNVSEFFQTKFGEQKIVKTISHIWRKQFINDKYILLICFSRIEKYNLVSETKHNKILPVAFITSRFKHSSKG